MNTLLRLMNRFGLLLIVLAGTDRLTVAGITNFQVSTGAAYQSGTDFDNAQRGRPLASTQSYVDLAMDGFSYAEATGKADGFQWPQSTTFQGADLSSLSRAAGYDPGHGPPDDQLSANSETRSRVLWWSNHGGAVQPGDDILVEVTLSTVGQIAASQFVDPNFQAQAWAGLSLDLIGGQGGAINYEGEIVVHADPMDGTALPSLNEEYDWLGAAFPGAPLPTGLGPLSKYVVDETDTFYFDSFIGEAFVLDFALGTAASAEGPYETYTLADFDSNYRLRSIDPATGMPIASSFLLITEEAADLDTDGMIGCSDIDQLTAAIAAGTDNPLFDLSGDGRVDTADLDQWLTIAGVLTSPTGQPYRYGDANLDGVVDGADFVVWNNHKFTSNDAWCSGDFTANGTVDGADFVQWNNNKFTTPDRVVGIPEPNVTAWWLVPLMWALRRKP